jgi:DNA repair protein RadC
MDVKLSKQQKEKPIYHAQDIYAIMQQVLLRENKIRRKQEFFWIIGIDNDRKIVFIELLALGATNRVNIKAPEAYRMAIYKLADYVMFVHNHPSGPLQPSPTDLDATDMLIKTGELVNIKVVDHFIINETSYLSMASEGIIKKLRRESTYEVLDKEEMELLKMQMETKKAEEMALSLLKDDMPVEFIVKHTGLSKAAVAKLMKGKK